MNEYDEINKYEPFHLHNVDITSADIFNDIQNQNFKNSYLLVGNTNVTSSADIVKEFICEDDDILYIQELIKTIVGINPENQFLLGKYKDIDKYYCLTHQYYDESTKEYTMINLIQEQQFIKKKKLVPLLKNLLYESYLKQVEEGYNTIERKIFIIDKQLIEKVIPTKNIEFFYPFKSQNFSSLSKNYYLINEQREKLFSINDDYGKDLNTNLQIIKYQYYYDTNQFNLLEKFNKITLDDDLVFVRFYNKSDLQKVFKINKNKVFNQSIKKEHIDKWVNRKYLEDENQSENNVFIYDGFDLHYEYLLGNYFNKFKQVNQDIYITVYLNHNGKIKFIINNDNYLELDNDDIVAKINLFFKKYIKDDNIKKSTLFTTIKFTMKSKVNIDKYIETLNEFPYYIKKIYEVQDFTAESNDLIMFKPDGEKWEGNSTGNLVRMIRKIDDDTYEIQFRDEIKTVSESRLKLDNRKKKIKKKYQFIRKSDEYKSFIDIAYQSLKKKQKGYNITFTNITIQNKFIELFLNQFMNYASLTDDSIDISSQIDDSEDSDEEDLMDMLDDDSDKYITEKPKKVKVTKILETIEENIERLKRYDSVYSNPQYTRDVGNSYKYPRVLSEIEHYNGVIEGNYQPYLFLKNGDRFYSENCYKNTLQQAYKKSLLNDKSQFYCDMINLRSNWYICPKLWSNKENTHIELDELDYESPYEHIIQFIEEKGNKYDKENIEDFINELYPDGLSEISKFLNYITYLNDLYDKNIEGFNQKVMSSVPEIEIHYQNKDSKKYQSLNPYEKEEVKNILITIIMHKNIELNWRYYYDYERNEFPEKNIDAFTTGRGGELFKKFSKSTKSFLNNKFKERKIHLKEFNPSFNGYHLYVPKIGHDGPKTVSAYMATPLKKKNSYLEYPSFIENTAIRCGEKNVSFRRLPW